ncbi:DNA topoisomerase [Clostridium butyricum]|uniref:DNA topoisomerase n=1 Tax=Clostridium butyricum TaxID=1492 RepID=UPI00374E2D2D
MGNKLIIAEKPSVAGSIAAALGATKRQDGYFEGNGYFVSYAFGHLYTLADTEDYNPEMKGSWNLKDYPFIPSEFKYKAIDNDGAKKQIKIIKELASKSDVIINSCDGDREGELIFAELNNNLKFNKPIKRLWITSHTPKDIEKGMSELKDGLINLEKAGYCRQQIDWILGINLTAIFTLKAGGEITLKLGRVILATLKLLYDREVAIANFKSQTFYTIKNKFTVNDEFYIGTLNYQEEGTRISDKSKVELIQEDIKDKPGTIIKKESKKANENPPKLFNLTDLQGYITDKYTSFTPDGVLAVMQSLYEKKHLTYPRTPSRYLDDNQSKDAQESLYAVIDIPELSINKDEIKFHTAKRVFDSSKVDSHPAIIPTYMIPDLDNLSEDEQIVYTEVTKRFIAQFMPAAVYDTLEIVTKVDEYEFITRGKVLTDEGWKKLYSKYDSKYTEEEDQEEQEKITAKNLNEGSSVLSSESNLKEGKTKPPAHYTNKTLLSAMETCGKSVENEEELLKGYMIGTSATRGDTISKLFDCGYIVQKGKNILLTDLGLKVVHHFPVKKLLTTSFTGQIEKTLKDMENGNYDNEVFMKKMTAYILDNINEMKNSEIPAIRRPVNIIGKCPKCGKNIIETAKAYSCEDTRDKKCNYTLWKENNFFKYFSKNFTETIAKDLVNKGKANVTLKNPKKDGEAFKATIYVEENSETGYWDFKFDNSKSSKKPGSKFKKGQKKTLKFK